MDLFLIVTAVSLLVLTHHREALLLTVAFSISSICADTRLIDVLGAYWYLIYACWLGIFCALSHSKLIIYGYLAALMTVLGGYIGFVWFDGMVIYPFLISGIFLLQLVGAYAEYRGSDTGGSDRGHPGGINLAFVERNS